MWQNYKEKQRNNQNHIQIVDNAGKKLGDKIREGHAKGLDVTGKVLVLKLNYGFILLSFTN